MSVARGSDPHRRPRCLFRRGLAVLGVAACGVFAVGLWKYWCEASAPPFDPATTELHFVELGAGPRRMVLLHGLAASARYWTSRVQPLSGDHRLLIPDLLGFGQSPKPRARYDLDDHLAALEKLVREQRFDGGHATIVGHSLGAVIALAMLGRHPEWFDGGVLIALPVFRNEAEAIARLGEHSWVDRGMLSGKWWARASHYVEPLFRLPWLAPLFDLPRDVYMDSMQHTWNSVSGTLRATIVEADYAALMDRAAVRPLLFIHGEEDDVAPGGAARALAWSRPHMRFVVVPGADHQVLLRDPDRVWALVRDFEREVSRP